MYGQDDGNKKQRDHSHDQWRSQGQTNQEIRIQMENARCRVHVREKVHPTSGILRGGSHLQGRDWMEGGGWGCNREEGVPKSNNQKATLKAAIIGDK